MPRSAAVEVVVVGGSVSVVCEQSVWITAGSGAGARVHDDGADSCHEMQEAVLDFVGDAVGLLEGPVRVDADLDFDVEPVADPTRPDPVNRFDRRRRLDDVEDLVRHLWIDGVEETPKHEAGGVAANDEDRGGDDEPGDRVCCVPAGGDAGGAGNYGERGEPVDAGVQAVGDECGRSDSAAGADSDLGGNLVAKESQHAGQRHHGQKVHVLWMDETVDRLVRGERGRGCNDQHDDDTSKVFCPPVAVGEALVGSPPAETERDPQRNRCQCVREIVQGIAEQRDRACENDDRTLRKRRRGKNTERQPERFDPVLR
jgi:hypothetical protein